MAAHVVVSLGIALCPQMVPTASRLPTVSHSAPQMLFGKSEAQQRAIDEAFEAQQAILRRRRNPRANAQYFKDVEKQREAETEVWYDKLAWQKRADDAGFNKLDEFKRRMASGKVKQLGYEDQKPSKKGSIPLPMASFGVGGEFGVGGKYDNGERFDLRLPYVDVGWVEEPKAKPKAGGSSKTSKKGGAEPDAPPAGPFDWLFGKKK